MTTSAPPTGGPRTPIRPRRRRRGRLVGLAVVVVVLLGAGAGLTYRQVAAGGTGRAEEESTEAGMHLPPSTQPFGVGVFRGTDRPAVQAFEAWSGRPVQYVVDFSTRGSWPDIADPQVMLDEWRGSGYRLVLGTAMLPDDDDSATIESGAGGAYDQWFTELAQHLVAGGQPDAIIRLGWEFNLAGSRWGSDDPQAWIAYYRRIVTAMRAVPGQRLQFDWNVNNGGSGADASRYYPGDDVVDYVGVDAYDQSWHAGTYPYPAGCDDSCRTERQDRAWYKDILGGERGLLFWASFAAGHRKPLSIPEWGVWSRPDGHGGGDDPAYVQRMHDFMAGHDVAYEAYFEYSASDGPHMLSDGTFPRSAAAYRTLFGAGG